MKYARLSKEQFEELHKEFINFLASQTITSQEWEDIKKNKPEVAEQELDVFSDLVWEGVLNKVEYIEHVSPQQIHLFHLKDENMHLIAIKIKNPIDLTTTDGFNWLRENLMDDDVEFLQANKGYTNDKNADKFKLIQQGGVITKGELYTYLNKLIN
ncbi:DUF6495 family protein [Formosa maritima]|uniref:Histidyl-tRNA synthetase n=1 Tax=Formosa maritima TaxID=2592046 RepID=A0A5D0GAY4_9FLAO|nr:DUF6495 family protein [Formosa maritima]TYA56044.1 hypothetical protein FVF61_07110 [Formosa maritima]